VSGSWSEREKTRLNQGENKNGPTAGKLKGNGGEAISKKKYHIDWNRKKRGRKEHMSIGGNREKLLGGWALQKKSR